MSTLADQVAWAEDRVNILVQELEQHIRLLDVLAQEGVIPPHHNNYKVRLENSANRLRRIVREVEEQRK